MIKKMTSNLYGRIKITNKNLLMQKAIKKDFLFSAPITMNLNSENSLSHLPTK